ncbi:MAG TPA: GGDEF domain-containing protein [Gemmatimonadales bacterium]|nr:GGDEF domain-containing protein [Gemmatimonadales bacterium]
MSVWEDTFVPLLRALQVGIVRNKILVLAVLSPLIPALATTCVFYSQNRSLLTDQVNQELRSASSETARELDAWLRERLADLRGAANSYVVSENLARIPGRDGAKALGRLREYLNSARERFPDQEGLVVIDPTGRVVAGSSGRVGGARVPTDGLNDLRTGDAFVGEAYWDASLAKAAIVLAVPVRQPDGRFLAAFAAKLNLSVVADILGRLSASGGDVYLTTDQGRLVIRSRVSSADLMRTRLPDAALSALFNRPGEAVVYRGADGRDVIAAGRQVPALRWSAVAEVPRAEAFRRVSGLWGLTAVMIVAVLAGIGLMVYVLASLVLGPLGRLSAAAAKVAAGDLTVELPVGGSGEVGYLTHVFSTVVVRLRERDSQAELERLSVTDALTGLYNRRHLVGTLANEVQRSRRLQRPFSVLLADVDHFKQYNDTLGHLEGDAALRRIADILRKSTRGVDCVARYGGEEFLVMLLETTVATGQIVAERIRAQVAAADFGGRRMTVSIGVAECPVHGDTPEALIASADAALYQAKGEGRDRVVTAAGPKVEKKGRRKGEG